MGLVVRAIEHSDTAKEHGPLPGAASHETAFQISFKRETKDDPTEGLQRSAGNRDQHQVAATSRKDEFAKHREEPPKPQGIAKHEKIEGSRKTVRTFEPKESASVLPDKLQHAVVVTAVAELMVPPVLSAAHAVKQAVIDDASKLAEEERRQELLRRSQHHDAVQRSLKPPPDDSRGEPGAHRKSEWKIR